MALAHSPGIVTSGLVFCYDMNNVEKSWRGIPTTNLLSDGMSIYNNVPSDVSASLTTTGEFYRGAAIYKLTLTPTTSTGVSYLTSGNNPGIGVVTGGGGGTANRYTGHAIFYRPTVPMHSVPIYTNYSNIPGWGAGSIGSNRSYSMGDGWFRSEVLWYDTVTRSDGKYWAINPASATINLPIVIYWAGPFKEDRNDSTIVSRYTPSSRSSLQSLIDLTNNHTITLSNVTYNADGTFDITGTNNGSVNASYSSNTNSISRSWEVFVRPNSSFSSAGIFGHVLGEGCTYYCNGGIAINGSNYIFNWYDNSNYQFLSSGVAATANQWAHVVGTFNASDTKHRIYVNGQLKATSGATNNNYGGASNNWQLGYWSASGNAFNGKIAAVKYYYNKCLSNSEVIQNFAALRGRYGI